VVENLSHNVDMEAVEQIFGTMGQNKSNQAGNASDGLGSTIKANTRFTTDDETRMIEVFVESVLGHIVEVYINFCILFETGRNWWEWRHFGEIRLDSTQREVR
jgi:hypothetical protein